MRTMLAVCPRLVLALFIAPTLLSTTALAFDEDADDDYEVTARVARLSLIGGEVSLRRSGDTRWERARLNFPLVEGDTLTTAPGARAEIQIDAYNYLRLGGDSALRVVTLREEGVALSLLEGTATLRLARFERDQEYFEIDAPGTTVAAERRGLYRIDVGREGSDVRVTVRDDGRARIYSETAGFTLRDRRTARLVRSGDEAGDWELASAADFDEWDRWTDERERYLAARLRYEQRERYYDRDVWGAEELDAYGDWTYVNTYGWLWRPHVTVINTYVNWAPYRYGRWEWVPPYGWTWVGDEPWGWAPYHYGRWVYYNNYWAWAPRGYGYAYKRSWWRPALVAFVYVPTAFGENLCWYPLTYGQRDPHSRRWRRDHERLRALRRDEIANLQRTNPAFLRAVSSLPAREFGAAHVRARPAPVEVARRAVKGEPVRGRLPVTPADAEPRVEEVGGGRTRLNIARPAPARPLPERQTGATVRAPGVSLDEELRRTRIFNRREPRVLAPGAGGTNAGVTHGGEPSTGAVVRPARPSLPRAPNERREVDGTDYSAPVARPVRPTRPAPEGDGGASAENPKRDGRVRRPGFRDESGEGRAPRVRGDENDSGGGNSEPIRPARPVRPREERPPASSPPPESSPQPGEEREPAPVWRHVPRERPEAREARPAPHDAPPPRRESPPRQEAPPPRQTEPPPPRREAPAEQPRERAPAKPARPPGRDGPILRDETDS